MRRQSQSRDAHSSNSDSCSVPSATDSHSPPPLGFLKAWDLLLPADQVPVVPPRRGAKPRVPLSRLLPALVFHFFSTAGSLSEHFSRLFGEHYADSSIADRRARLPWEVMAQLLRRMLGSRAQESPHPEAFWRGWRLVALDGIQFSLTNTPQIKASAKKAKSRRGKAAFAKIATSVLLEIGLHNPLATAIGRQGESEWALSRQLLSSLPKGALLLGDRLYGCAAFVIETLKACAIQDGCFLFRVRTNIKAQELKRHRDGSRLVRVPVRAQKSSKILEHIEVREIRAHVERKGFRSQQLRFWTNLLNDRQAPARELVQLYAKRWEHELYYRELKGALQKGDVLHSHTLETAGQEIAAMVLASALVAAERVRVAKGERPVLGVSFVKVLALLRPLWLVLELCGDLLTEKQREAVAERFYQQMEACVVPQRRQRSCPRAVRQPIKKWPRLQKNESTTGPFQIHIIRMPG